MARIVICDDDETYALMVKDFLEGDEHSVLHASDAAQLSVLLGSELPNLIILDMQMAGGGGPGAVKFIKDQPRLAGVPLIINSGMPVSQQKQWFQSIPNIRFLQKPVQLPDLRNAVKELLSGKA